MSEKTVPQRYANLALREQREQLAALRAENDRLKGENHDLSLAGFTLRDGNKQMLDEIVAADARIAELKAALRPFAEGRLQYHSLTTEPGYDHFITVDCRESDISRAAAALKESV